MLIFTAILAIGLVSKGLIKDTGDMVMCHSDTFEKYSLVANDQYAL